MENVLEEAFFRSLESLPVGAKLLCGFEKPAVVGVRVGVFAPPALLLEVVQGLLVRGYGFGVGSGLRSGLGLG